MAEKIRLVQGDTRPTLVCTITDDVTGGPIGLQDATVKMKFRQAGTTTIRSTLTGAVTNAAQGQVLFFWSDDPTALNGEPGDYEGEIEITFADGAVQTVYDLLKFKLREDF